MNRLKHVFAAVMAAVTCAGVAQAQPDEIRLPLDKVKLVNTFAPLTERGNDWHVKVDGSVNGQEVDGISALLFGPNGYSYETPIQSFVPADPAITDHYGMYTAIESKQPFATFTRQLPAPQSPVQAQAVWSGMVITTTWEVYNGDLGPGFAPRGFVDEPPQGLVASQPAATQSKPEVTYFINGQQVTAQQVAALNQQGATPPNDPNDPRNIKLTIKVKVEGELGVPLVANGKVSVEVGVEGTVGQAGELTRIVVDEAKKNLNAALDMVKSNLPKLKAQLNLIIRDLQAWLRDYAPALPSWMRWLVKSVATE